MLRAVVCDGLDEELALGGEKHESWLLDLECAPVGCDRVEMDRSSASCALAAGRLIPV
jgi:hypothetical protein